MTSRSSITLLGDRGKPYPGLSSHQDQIDFQGLLCFNFQDHTDFPGLPGPIKSGTFRDAWKPSASYMPSETQNTQKLWQSTRPDNYQLSLIATGQAMASWATRNISIFTTHLRTEHWPLNFHEKNRKKTKTRKTRSSVSEESQQVAAVVRKQRQFLVVPWAAPP